MCRILAIAILLALATLNAACVATSHSDKHSVWLHYEPEVVTLRGRLTETTEYGPPNYGENPETDSIEHPIILVLPRPVRVQGDPSSDLNTETVSGITRIQLVMPGNVGVDFPPNYEGEVEVTGTLFGSHTAHHHTKVLMTVETLAPVNAQQSDAEKRAMKIAEDYVAENYKIIDTRNLKPVIKDEGDYWNFYYELPSTMMGGAPVVLIDKRTLKIIRSYMTQ